MGSDFCPNVFLKYHFCQDKIKQLKYKVSLWKNNDESKRKYISPELEVMIMEMEYWELLQVPLYNQEEVVVLRWNPWEDGGKCGNGEPGNEWWN